MDVLGINNNMNVCYGLISNELHDFATYFCILIK